MQGIRRDLDKLYNFSILFPALVVFISWAFFYSLGHWDHKYLPTISVTVIKFPENHIFAAGMFIESIVLFYLLFIRHVIFICQYEYIQTTIKIIIKHFFFILSGLISIIGLIALSSITLQDNFIAHNLAASCFFFGSFIHYCFVDSLFIDTGTFLRQISEYITYSIIIFAFIYMFFLSSESNFCKSIAAILQYLCCLLIFLKIYLIHHDMPRHIITTKLKINHTNELREQAI